MQVQLINFRGQNDNEYDVSKVSDFHNMSSPDQYELNIIDIRHEGIWRNENKKITYDYVTLKKDFDSIYKMIINSKETKYILILPQNLKFQTNYFTLQPAISSIKTYNSSEFLKDLDIEFESILNRIIPFHFFNINYEKTSTYFNDNVVKADFYFDDNIDAPIKIKSYLSKKLVAFKVNEYIITSLDIKNNEQLLDLYREFKLIDDITLKQPDWFKEIEMFDDEIQNEIVLKSESIIAENYKQIDEANKILKANNELKSVLYTNGEDLARVVIFILEKIFETTLENFVDEKKEDFLFFVDNTYFIGEIKGINSNIKSSNLGQLDHHYLEYIEKHNSNPDHFKKLLIINHQRNKQPDKRETVHENQVKDANNKYGILIVETIELLKLYEKKKMGEITYQDCIEQLKSTGLFKARLLIVIHLYKCLSTY